MEADATFRYYYLFELLFLRHLRVVIILNYDCIVWYLGTMVPLVPVLLLYYYYHERVSGTFFEATARLCDYTKFVICSSQPAFFHY